ncbi:sulfotransferase [Parvibaculum lavamentivorans DS-1]|uniref:Sulfotransferase n=1 Tax=Parvibaculum lavamentivorans (strain DS-1 / DSM 13023 / NCIMB 13966) TaxID=402881 RepID=A7HSM0_PARL1|nr:sulfotransferase domain-containing protein [Parvibaculum lavamentivorans]ABS62903.1 sulfotransferase [Parvibaculum lavamentivorans DS-1]
MGALIWLASYPKSGNTWMRSFLHNLFRNGQQPVSLNEIDDFCLGASASKWYQRYTSTPSVELSSEEIARYRMAVQRDFMTVFPDSVFVKTHDYLGEYNNVPLHNMDVTAGAIYIVRNPLDVVLSMVPHFGIPLDQAIVSLANEGAQSDPSDAHVPEHYGSWSTNVRTWTRTPRPGLLVMRYEDMLDKPRKSFKTVASFLGLKPSSERLERAIKFSSFKVLKAQEEREGFKERPKVSKSFFREGKRDQWREKLTPDQVRRIIADHHEQMERFGYIPDDYRDAVPTGAPVKASAG